MAKTKQADHNPWFYNVPSVGMGIRFIGVGEKKMENCKSPKIYERIRGFTLE